MFKKYTFWLKASSVLQLLTAAMHSLSLITKLIPANETEKQMMNLMSDYHFNMGQGFTPTMENFMLSFSICFVLFLLIGGINNLYLLSKKADVSILKGITGISVILFGLCFVTMLFLTFLAPIICTGLIFLCLIISYFTIPRYDRF